MSSSGPTNGDVTVVADHELLDRLRDVERERNRLAAREYALLAEVERRGIAQGRGCKTTAVLLRELLRVTPYEARSRVRAALDLAPRVGLTGEMLEPVFAVAAAALADGSISPTHAKVIRSTVDALPDAVQASDGAAVEATLTEQSLVFDPDTIHGLARRIHGHLDPDGRLSDSTQRERRRGFSVRKRPDGSASVTAELTAQATEVVLTVFDTLARPMPEVDGQRDPRTWEQRCHDALVDALTRLLRSGTLPECGGAPATVVITMSDEAWRTGRGTATTGHGSILSARDAISLAGGDHQLLTVAMDRMGAVTAHSGLHRSFTPSQRLAMAARDGGCSFPGCTVPASWCQAHHIREWQHDGRTVLVNGTLLCGWHHREFQKLGWVCRTSNGRPAWIPPKWLDPAQAPRQNTALHLDLEFGAPMAAPAVLLES